MDANKCLGVLCPRGHSHEGTGQSVRYKADGRCIKCRAISREKFRANNGPRLREQNRRYRAENRKLLLARRARYRLENREVINRRAREKLRSDPEYRAKVKLYRKGPGKEHIDARKRKATRELADSYIKLVLMRHMSFASRADIPPELIEMKRQGLIMFRTLKQLRGVAHESDREDAHGEQREDGEDNERGV